jgi:hypothetical protein
MVKFFKNSSCLNCIVTLVFLIVLVYYSDFGFDLSDEGYYLNNIQNWHNYKFTVSQFGFFFHYLSFWLSQDIHLLRLMNILITFFLSCWYSYLFLFSILPKKSLKQQYAVIAFSISILSLLNFDRLLITPNYNTMNFQSILLAMIGILYLERRVYLGIFFIAVGGWISFLAKPTSALALGFIVLINIFFIKKNKFKTIFLSIILFFLLLFVTGLQMDGSIEGFISRYRLGLFLASKLDPMYSLIGMFRLDGLRFSFFERFYIIGNLLSFILISFFVFSSKKFKENIFAFICVLFFGLIFFLKTDIFSASIKSSPRSIIIIAIPCGVLLLGSLIALKYKHSFLCKSKILRSFSFILLPFAYSFGTGTNVLMKASHANIFWLFGVIFLFSERIFLKFLRFSPFVILLIQFMSTIVLFSWLNSPYRQKSFISSMREPKIIGIKKSKLYLDLDQIEYLSLLEKKLYESGFLKGHYIIDLTGRSPGVIYALGGIAVGQPWLLGGYKGSSDVAINSLKMVDREILINSWVLTEPKSPGSLPLKILDNLDLNLDDNYELMFSIPVKVNLKNTVLREQQIYKFKSQK